MTPAHDDAELLRQYLEDGSREALGELAVRYSGLVYSAARRQVRDAHLAEDVTQAVFIVLAEKAGSIPANRPLSAWLLKTTSYTAANARRLRSRRQAHERKAAEMAAEMERANQGEEKESGWTELTPLLDEGLHRLKATDRSALLLRYFEHKSLREVGEALGLSEEAAAKRVSRAVDKLRDYFQRKGVPVSSMALGAQLTTHAIQHAPAHLAPLAAGTALTKGAAAAGTTMPAKSVITVMTIKKVAAGIALTMALLVSVGTITYAAKLMLAQPRKQQITVALPSAQW